jgi:pyrroloquinoline quinone biosynthesis protein B
MSEVPHPFVKETMLLFSKTGIETTSKIHFIHLNHTNPVLWDQTKQDSLRTAGFNIARQGEKL